MESDSESLWVQGVVPGQVGQGQNLFFSEIPNDYRNRQMKKIKSFNFSDFFLFLRTLFSIFLYICLQSNKKNDELSPTENKKATFYLLYFHFTTVSLWKLKLSIKKTATFVHNCYCPYSLLSPTQRMIILWQNVWSVYKYNKPISLKVFFLFCKRRV